MANRPRRRQGNETTDVDESETGSVTSLDDLDVTLKGRRLRPRTLVEEAEMEGRMSQEFLDLLAIQEDSRERAEQRREDKRLKAEERREERRLEEKRERAAEKLARQQEEEDRRERFRLEREAERQAEQLRREEERQAEQQRREEWQAGQQRELLRMQMDLRAKEEALARKESTARRKREQRLTSMAKLGPDEDLEQYLTTMEAMFHKCETPQEEWGDYLGSNMTGVYKSVVANLQVLHGEDYLTIKEELLKSAGLTWQDAAHKLLAMTSKDIGSMSVPHLIQKVGQLIKRWLPQLTKDQEFHMFYGHVLDMLPRAAKSFIINRTVQTMEALTEALHLYIQQHGSFSDYTSFPLRETLFKCFSCGEKGHKAQDCPVKRGTSATRPEMTVEVRAPDRRTDSVPRPVKCYSCGELGHKSPQCPTRQRNKVNPKDISKVTSERKHEGNVVDGFVNDKPIQILLDSGADITVVPRSVVHEHQLTGGSMEVAGFQSPRTGYPMAEVTVRIGDFVSQEKVVVAPSEEGKTDRVLYALGLQTVQGLKLIQTLHEKSSRVLQVETRAQARLEAELRESEKVDLEEEEVRVRDVASAPEGVQESVVLEEEDDELALGDMDEDRLEENDLVVEQEAPEVSDEDEDLSWMIRECKEIELEMEPVCEGSSRKVLVKETQNDPSLAAWRSLADSSQKGFRWREGVLVKTRTDHLFQQYEVVVLPVSLRDKVLHIAHDRLGHLGPKKVREIVHRKFTWPGIAKTVLRYCRSCVSCQRHSKERAAQAPMVSRRVMTEPFESMAFDIVGPFPKAKGGFRFLLTCVCMSSRWPEAIPLKTVTAKVVAQGMIEVFSRTGIPLELLTDQGPQFVGRLIRHLCEVLGIDKLQTAPYRPQCNGMVERMHRTLGSMLRKATDKGLDWAQQVPFAMFALRAAPNRDTQLSPYELVFGKHVKTPLDLLHHGWVDGSSEPLDVAEWGEVLAGQLEIMRDVAREKGLKVVEERKEDHDRKAVLRELNEGDCAWVRSPGIDGKLDAAWLGPYPVLGKTSAVNYKLDLGRGRHKVWHINNLKRFVQRECEVLRVTVVADEVKSEEVKTWVLTDRCDGYCQEDIDGLVAQSCQVFSQLPGRTDACILNIDTGQARPVSLSPYRVPEKFREGLRAEIDNLAELGIIEPSASPWQAPVVPVPKPDGTVRMCIDYRRLNAVTLEDGFYMPTFDDILERIGYSKVLTKLDLAKGYYQVEVAMEDRDKTTFISPFGKYRFTRMPFGLKNAPAIFQRLVDKVLRDCFEFAATYIDDILVFSKTWEEHIEHLGEVLQALERHGLTVKPSKVEFGRKYVEYLGHVVGDGKVAIPAHRVTAMADFKQPVSRRQMKSFLGGISYYRRFIPDFASYSALLTPATSGKAPSTVDWTVDMLDAFHHLRSVLSNVSSLFVPVSTDVFTVHTDASGVGIGATLNVVREGKTLPVAYFAKQLQGAQKRYSATELEGLAVLKAIHHFAHYLYGRHFTVVTDHKALCSLLSSRVLNRRLQGWMLRLQDFQFKVIYRKGKDNADADAMSRQAWGDTPKTPPSGVGVADRRAVSIGGGDVGPRPHKEREKD